MQPDPAAAAYLRDMLESCKLVREFVSNRTLDQYKADVFLRSAVERQIEIVGEAARHLAPQFRDAHPQVPWRSIIAQRHVLAHDYGDIEDPLIWRVATVHVPALIPLLESLLPSAEGL
jgi:uncharacterized protein with HEPN domain